MTDDRIPPNPLDPGDDFQIDVELRERTERVWIDVPPGKGLVFAHWLHRHLTETPEQAQARRAADLLAELKGTA